MNAKYYPALRKVSEVAAQVVKQDQNIDKAAKKPADIVTKVYQAANVTKDEALEVAKVIFYGYYKEVNTYYGYKV